MALNPEVAESVASQHASQQEGQSERRQASQHERTESRSQALEDDTGNIEGDLKSDKFSYEKDFCLRMAVIVSEEYTSTQVFQKHLHEIIALKKKREKLSSILRFYNALYKNILLTTQMKALRTAYQEATGDLPKGADNLPFLDDKNRHEIEQRCVKIFSKLPNMQAIINEHLENELLKIFRIQDSHTLHALIKLFFRNVFVGDILQSALFINISPAEIMPVKQFSDLDCDKAHLALTSAAKHILFAISAFRAGLKAIYVEQFQKFGGQSKATDRKLSEKTLVAKDKLVSEESQVDAFLRKYLIAIVGDQLLQEELQEKAKKEALEKGLLPELQLFQPKGEVALVKEQLIRVPILCEAMSQSVAQSAEMKEGIEPYVIRSALDIVEATDPRNQTGKKIKPERLDGQEERMLFVAAEVDSCELRTKRVLRKGEAQASLFGQTPIIATVNDATAVSDAVMKVARLADGSIREIGPYMLLAQTPFLVISSWSSHYSINHPGQLPSHGLRFYKSFNNGMKIFVAALGLVINVKLMQFPPGTRVEISAEEFCKTLLPYPVGISLFKMGLGVVSPIYMEKTCPTGTVRGYFRKIVDFAADYLSSFALSFFFNLTFFKFPNTDVYQIYLPLGVGFPIAVAQQIKYIKEKVGAFVSLANFTIFLSSFIKNSLPGSALRENEYNWEMSLRAVVMGGIAVFSIYLYGKKRRQYQEEFVPEDELVTEFIFRKVTLPIRNGEIDPSGLEDGLLLDMQEYKALEDEFSKDGKKGAQALQKTLLHLQDTQQRKHAEAGRKLSSSKEQRSNSEQAVVPTRTNSVSQSEGPVSESETGSGPGVRAGLTYAYADYRGKTAAKSGRNGGEKVEVRRPSICGKCTVM